MEATQEEKKSGENLVRVTIEQNGHVVHTQDGTAWVIVGCVDDYKALRGIIGSFDTVSKLIVLTELKKTIQRLSADISEEDLAIADMLAIRHDDDIEE